MSFLFAIAVSLLPPMEFDRPYAGTLFEDVLPIAQVDAECRRLTGATREKTVRGCSVKYPGGCLIIYPNAPIRGIDPLDIRRHEIAHCNGWKHEEIIDAS
jgi:hypothetical protein